MLEAAWSSLSLHAFEWAFRHALAQSVALSWLRAVHRPLLPPCGFARFCSRLRTQDLSCLGRLGCGFSSMRRAVRAVSGTGLRLHLWQLFPALPCASLWSVLAMGMSMSRFDIGILCSVGTFAQSLASCHGRRLLPAASSSSSRAVFGTPCLRLLSFWQALAAQLATLGLLVPSRVVLRAHFCNAVARGLPVSNGPVFSCIQPKLASLRANALWGKRRPSCGRARFHRWEQPCILRSSL